jgi:PST family polysaccharide transporter
MVMRVASWPMAFVLVARGERKLYFWAELLTNGLFIALVWTGLSVFGLKGSGIAFFSMYAAYWLSVYLIVRRLSGFRWSAANRRLALIFLPVVTLVFVSRYFLPNPAVVAVGSLLTLAVGIYSLKILSTLVPLERFPEPLRKMLPYFKLASPVTNDNHPT